MSTGKLNKIDLHMDNVNNELFHSKSNVHKYNIEESDDDLTVSPCITGTIGGPAYSETDHLMSNQVLHISKSAMSKFGYSGQNIINNANSEKEKELDDEEYHSDIKLNTSLLQP